MGTQYGFSSDFFQFPLVLFTRKYCSGDVSADAGGEEHARSAKLVRDDAGVRDVAILHRVGLEILVNNLSDPRRSARMRRFDRRRYHAFRLASRLEQYLPRVPVSVRSEER